MIGDRAVTHGVYHEPPPPHRQVFFPPQRTRTARHLTRHVLIEPKGANANRETDDTKGGRTTASARLACDFPDNCNYECMAVFSRPPGIIPKRNETCSKPKHAGSDALCLHPRAHLRKHALAARPQTNPMLPGYKLTTHQDMRQGKERGGASKVGSMCGV